MTAADKLQPSGLVEQMTARFSNFLGGRFPTLVETRANELARNLVASYDDGTRVYHDLSHIHQCLKALDELNLDAPTKATIELALWYHDVVYDPFSKSNEAESAERLTKELGSETTDLDLKLVEEMIRASTHRADESAQRQQADQQTLDLFLDIDLGILGRSPDAYARYAKQIRQEYKRVPFFLFYPGRKKLLNALIKKPIFRSDLFKEKFEKQAKLNITAELRDWRYRLSP